MATQQAFHEQEHGYAIISKHQVKVQVVSDKQPHMTSLSFSSNFAGSLFGPFKETQGVWNPFDQENKSLCSLGL
jgi:hypothetical protein